MSMDKSLIVKSKLERSRNVLKRDERVARLKEEEKWEEGQSVFGLPKTLVEKVKRTKAKAKKKKEEEAEAEAEAGAEAGAESPETPASQ